MDTTIIQVPVNKVLRDQAAAASSRLGFSSLQEAIRVFLAQLPTQSVKITFEHPPVQLSPKAIKRYDRLSEEIASGKVKPVSFTSIDDMFDYLNS